MSQLEELIKEYKSYIKVLSIGHNNDFIDGRIKQLEIVVADLEELLK